MDVAHSITDLRQTQVRIMAIYTQEGELRFAVCKRQLYR